MAFRVWQDTFLITFLCFLLGDHLLLSLVSFKYILKPLVVLLTLLNASADYFMNKYQVVYDPGMIRNIVETDFHEALGLMTGIGPPTSFCGASCQLWRWDCFPYDGKTRNGNGCGV